MTWKQKTLQPVTGRQCISGSIIHDSSLINSLDGGYYSNWDEKAKGEKMKHPFGNIVMINYLHKSYNMYKP